MSLRKSWEPTLNFLPPMFACLEIKSLYESGFCKPNEISWGAYEWSRDDVTPIYASFKVDLTGEPKDHSIYVQHLKDGQLIQYKIQFEYAKAGNCNRRFFICPVTGKRVTKLYCLRGYFRSRESTLNCMRFRNPARDNGLNPSAQIVYVFQPKHADNKPEFFRIVKTPTLVRNNVLQLFQSEPRQIADNHLLRMIPN